jgi:predicted DNA-binding transcriptional regulator YafY
LGSALRKVMVALPAPHRPGAEEMTRRVLIDSSRWMVAPRSPVDMAALQDAVFADRRLRIRYRRSGEARARGCTVDPYGLVAKAGTWYLVADRRGVPRLFHTDRIAALTVTDEPVRRRPGVELADVWRGLRRDVEEQPAAVRIRARVRRARLDMFVRIVGAWIAAPPEDGDAEWVTVELGYPAIGAVRQLLQFGLDVEVLSPPEARRIAAETATAIARAYE